MSQAACPGVVGVVDRPAVGRGHAHGAQQHAGHFLVLRNRLGDGAGAIGLGGLNAALLAAVAEQNQALGVQPAVGNAAGLRRFDDGPRARAQDTLRWARFAEPLDFAGDVEGPIVDRGQAKLAGHGQALAAHRLLDILDDDLVDALFRGFAGLAETDLRAGQRLQFQRDVFEDVAQIGAVAQALKEAAALADAATMLDHAWASSSSNGR